MVLYIIRKLFGYISFKVSGGNPDKFLNLLAKNGFNVWNIKKENGDLTAKTIATEFESVCKLAGKSNSQIEILKKSGIPFWVKKYKNRFGFLVGFFCFIIILLMMPMYVWKVEVKGCNNMSEDEVKKIMCDLGVWPGALKNSINFPLAQQNAMSRLGAVSWVSLNLKGSTVEVLIKEKVIPPEKNEPEDTGLCNITAAASGVIERTETYRGAAVVKPGDVVSDGQLLISGIIENPSGGNEFVSADGKVYAKTLRKISLKEKVNQICICDTGKTTQRCRIKIFSFEIPLSFAKKMQGDHRYEFSERHVDFLGARLPITVFREKGYEQQQIEKNLDIEQAKSALEKKFEEFEKDNFGDDLKIINKSMGEVRKSENGEEYVQECQYECLENIAKKQQMIFEN